MEQNRSGGYFGFERLDAYRLAKELVCWVGRDLLPRIPRGFGDLKDQLRRASPSVMLNVAEGSQYESVAMAKKHYRYARASNDECFAALDALDAIGVERLDPGIDMTRRLGAMLRRLAE